MDVLDLPMIFDSHEHAARVLDGRVGERLKEELHKDSDGRLRALGFTYSGGVRHFYTHRKGQVSRRSPRTTCSACGPAAPATK